MQESALSSCWCRTPWFPCPERDLRGSAGSRPRIMYKEHGQCSQNRLGNMHNISILHTGSRKYLLLRMISMTPSSLQKGMKRLTKTISGFYLDHSKKNRMICLPGHGRNRPTLLSSTIGRRQRGFTLRFWQEWPDAWALWMTGCCAALKAGGTGWLYSKQRTSAGSRAIG